MSPQSAIILTAGPGHRFWPYATIRNKGASPIANVPNIRRLLDSVAEIGVRRVVVVLGHQPGSVRAALVGCSADVAFVEGAGGTAGAVLAGAAALGDECFLVVYGDVVTTTENLRHFVTAHEAGELPGAAMWDPMPAAEGSLWCAAEVEDGQLREIVGHESEAQKRLCGVFAVDRSILPVLEANPGYMKRVPVGGMPPMEPDFAQSLNDWDRPILAVEAADFVVDLDKPWHLLEANRLMARHLCSSLTENEIDPTARIDDGAEIVGPIRIGPGVEIGKRVVIEGPAIVAEGTRIVNGAILRGTNIIGAQTRISDYCLLGESTVVGSDCIVGHGAEMDGVMMDGSYLWHYCEISGVVGLSVDIGAATVCGTLRFDDGPARHKVRGRREKPVFGSDATYLGDYCRTGVNVITMPGAKVGCYSCVGAGIVVYGDVPDRTLRILKQDTVDRPWGPERYGW